MNHAKTCACGGSPGSNRYAVWHGPRCRRCGFGPNDLNHTRLVRHEGDHDFEPEEER